MSTNVGWATLTIIPSTKGFAGALSSSIGSSVANTGAAQGQKAGTAFGNAFKQIAAGMAAFGMVEGITNFTRQAISGASDLEQSYGAVSAIFEAGSKDIQTWSTQAAASVGLPKREFNELATLLGAQLRNTGTPMEELAGKTNNLMVLASDLAATYNTSVSDAVRAISATFRGERDPIEKYGITLRQSDIDAAAAAQGFEKVNGKLTAEGNAAGTLALLMDQARVAQGMFAKESNTFYGQLTRLRAGFDNVRTAIGGLFLPAMTSAMGALNAFVLPLSVVLNTMSDCRDEGLGFRDTMAAIGEALKTADLGNIMNGIRDVFMKAADQFVTTKNNMAPMITIIESIINMLNPLRAAVIPFTAILEGIMPALGAISAELGVNMTNSLRGLVPAFASFATALLPVMQTMMPSLQNLFIQLAGAIAKIIPFVMEFVNVFVRVGLALAESLIPVFQVLIDSILPPLAQAFGNLFQLLTPLMQTIGVELANVVGILGEAFLGVVQALAPLFEQLPHLVSLLEPLIDLIGEIVGFLPELLAPLTSVASTIMEVLVQAILAILPPLIEITQRLVEALVPVLPSLVSLVEAVANAFIQLLPALLPLIPPVMEFVTALIDALLPLLPSLINVIDMLAQCFVELAPPLIKIVEATAEELGPTLRGLIPIVESVVSFIGPAIEGCMQFIMGVIQMVCGIITGDWETAWEGIKNTCRGFGEAVLNILGMLEEGVIKVFDFLAGLIVDSLGGSWEDFKRFISDTWNSLTGWLHDIEKWGQDIEDTITEFIGGIPAKIEGFFENCGDWLIDSGHELIGGFIEGIVNFDPDEALEGVMDRIRDFFPFSPAKRGPFSGKGYTTHSGAALARDFAAGIVSGLGAATAAGSALNEAVQNTIGAEGQAGLASELLTQNPGDWAAMGQTVAEGVNTLSDAVATGMTETQTVWTTTWDGMAVTLATDWTAMNLTTATNMAAVQETTATTMANVQATLNSVLPPVNTQWNTTWQNMQMEATNQLNTINTNTLNGLNLMNLNVTTKSNELFTFWNTHWTQMMTTHYTLWKIIQDNLLSGMIFILNTIIEHMNALQMTWTVGWNAVHNVVADAWNKATQACRDGMAHVIEVIRELPGNIRGAIGNVGDTLKASGESMMNGFVEGIRAAGNRVGDAVARSISNSTDGLNLGSVMLDSMASDALSAVSAISPLMVSAARQAADDSYEALAFDPPTVDAPEVRNGGVMGQLGAVNTEPQPLVGNLTFQSSGNVRDDVNEAMFQLRRIQRGGAHA